ncbi:16S rRNA (adenine(1518)-N(6)/adenine(1519)-N(6))-dimethyltransferase RsmA [Pedomonas mirosovicensis]|uniref:16S rRNA (adenine(1518)-N(6)/adenine(1519)-N(6))- dimethyltransferase RsmA n=1 Tax=Pedomonas mirosovicensis TaxID=2908641 RepID=UPI002168BDD7|nr:16S rRNA (adenine(1518)-N(6)/adenine(1519)-N(6))-dimethyltransferase RsmA [Pedomonas mirosovicensis]MCH8685310.1 16S rRNA (adenine(1518)-N(6)/adenine(1519)-N(6))-dimethyltransferase RsmA [Pedomonas mirosovicensis]
MIDQDFLSSLPPLREVIAEHGLNAKKSLGQNFLFDMNLLSRIVRTAGPLEGHTVYEVGPGPGGLTRAILAAGAERLIAVEMDQRAWPILEDLNTRSGGRLDVIPGDAMKVDEATLLAGKPVRIIANLPYNVGTALLVRWLTTRNWPPFWSSLTLMFQKEVAERIVAKPNTADYGRLAVLAQWRSKPRIAFDVPRQAFTPPPKVTSAVVHIEPAEPIADVPLKSLEAVTAAAFGQRRKMLRASLKSLGLDPTPILEMADIPGDLRAEVLDVPAFCRLAAAHAALMQSRKSS